MSLTYNIHNGDLVCTFPRRMDGATCTKWEQEILSKIEDFENAVIFDLEQLNYISSAFLRVCLAVCKKVGTDKFSCINVRPSIKKVFSIAGFDKIMNIE